MVNSKPYQYKKNSEDVPELQTLNRKSLMLTNLIKFKNDKYDK